MQKNLSFLPYGRQHIDADDIAAVVECLRSDWLTQGPRIAEFEAALAARVGADHAVVCNTGTAALHLALLGAGLRPDNIAIVPAITFLATANAVRYCGAEVAFCDVDPETGLMRPQDLANCLDRLKAEGVDAKRIACALPVHLNGQIADMPGLTAIAEKAGILLIEDACHALGAEWGPAPSLATGSCAYSFAACFSFHPVKSIATGEGGAVTTRDAAAAAAMRRLRSHGTETDPAVLQPEFLESLGPNGTYAGVHQMRELGFNYRLTDMQCALGISQLKKLDGFLQRRRQVAAWYDEKLVRLSNLLRPIRWAESCAPSYHLYPILVRWQALGLTRGDGMKALRERGIGTQVHYIPVHRQPYYAGRYGIAGLPGADAYFDAALSLPIFVDMEEEHVDQVIETLEAVLKR